MDARIILKYDEIALFIVVMLLLMQLIFQVVWTNGRKVFKFTTCVFKAISRAAATHPFESTRRLRRAARRRHMIILIYNATKIQKQIIP